MRVCLHTWPSLRSSHPSPLLPASSSLGAGATAHPESAYRYRGSYQGRPSSGEKTRRPGSCKPRNNFDRRDNLITRAGSTAKSAGSTSKRNHLPHRIVIRRRRPGGTATLLSDQTSGLRESIPCAGWACSEAEAPSCSYSLRRQFRDTFITNCDCWSDRRIIEPDVSVRGS